MFRCLWGELLQSTSNLSLSRSKVYTGQSMQHQRRSHLSSHPSSVSPLSQHRLKLSHPRSASTESFCYLQHFYKTPKQTSIKQLGCQCCQNCSASQQLMIVAKGKGSAQLSPACIIRIILLLRMQLLVLQRIDDEFEAWLLKIHHPPRGGHLYYRFCQVTKGPSFHQTQKLGPGHLTLAFPMAGGSTRI